MENIEQKLFHGINLTNYGPYIVNLTETKILEMILSSRKLETRDDLKLRSSSIIKYINTEYCQNSDEVCVALHPHNTIYQSIEGKYEDAYYDFVMFHLSIILNEKLLVDKIYSIKGMPREIRVKSSIFLPEYIEAIGYYDKITSMTKKIEELIENKNYIEIKQLFFEVYYRDFLRAKDIKEYINNEYQKYNQIQQLLQEYGYNIPIIDPYTGIEHDSIDANLIKAKTTLKKIKSIREKI